MRKPSPAPVLDLAEATKVTPCCSKVGLKRGPWTVEEDEVLSSFIRREGEGKWRTLPKRAGLQRCGKSCRLRWMNYLRPSVKRGKIAPDEEDLILRLHRLLGNRWSLIAGRLPGRTDNEIKNYWNTHLRKKLIRQGIDPRTHKPLNTELLCSSLELDSQAVASPVPTSTSLSPNLSPNPNPNPNVQFKNATSSLGNQSNDISLDLLDPFNNRHYFGGSTFDLAGDWPAFDNIEAIAGASPNSHAVGEAVENKDVNCSTDDLFSSFLNSLINDEVPEQDTLNSDGIWNNAQATLPLENQVLSFENQVFWEPASFAYSEIFNEGEHNVNPSTNDMGQKL